MANSGGSEYLFLLVKLLFKAILRIKIVFTKNIAPL
jgi:hypothetical protein